MQHAYIHKTFVITYTSIHTYTVQTEPKYMHTYKGQKHLQFPVEELVSISKKAAYSTRWRKIPYFWTGQAHKTANI